MKWIKYNKKNSIRAWFLSWFKIIWTGGQNGVKLRIMAVNCIVTVCITMRIMIEIKPNIAHLTIRLYLGLLVTFSGTGCQIFLCLFVFIVFVFCFFGGGCFRFCCCFVFAFSEGFTSVVWSVCKPYIISVLFQDVFLLTTSLWRPCMKFSSNTSKF